MQKFQLTDRSKSAFKKALNLFNDPTPENLKEALLLFSQVPSFLKAYCYFKLKNFKKALKILKKLKSTDRNEILKSQIYYYNKNYKKAEKLLSNHLYSPESMVNFIIINVLSEATSEESVYRPYMFSYYSEKLQGKYSTDDLDSNFVKFCLKSENVSELGKKFFERENEKIKQKFFSELKALKSYPEERKKGLMNDFNYNNAFININNPSLFRESLSSLGSSNLIADLALQNLEGNDLNSLVENKNLSKSNKKVVQQNITQNFEKNKEEERFLTRHNLHRATSMVVNLKCYLNLKRGKKLELDEIKNEDLKNIFKALNGNNLSVNEIRKGFFSMKKLSKQINMN